MQSTFLRTIPHFSRIFPDVLPDLGGAELDGRRNETSELGWARSLGTHSKCAPPPRAPPRDLPTNHRSDPPMRRNSSPQVLTNEILAPLRGPQGGSLEL